MYRLVKIFTLFFSLIYFVLIANEFINGFITMSSYLIKILLTFSNFCNSYNFDKIFDIGTENGI